MKVTIFDYNGSEFEIDLSIIKSKNSYVVTDPFGRAWDDLQWAQVYQIIDATDEEIEALQKIGWLEIDDEEEKYVAVY